MYKPKVLVNVVGVVAPQQHEPRNLAKSRQTLIYRGKDLAEHEPFERPEVTVLWQLNRIDIHGVFSLPSQVCRHKDDATS